MDIRHALAALAHPECRIRLRNTGDELDLGVRILGIDARSSLFFWRLGEAHADLLENEAELARLAALTLGFHGRIHDHKTGMQFHAGPSTVLQFSDRSLLMITPFPQSLRQFSLDG